MDPPGGYAGRSRRQRKEIDMALIAMTRKSGRKLATTTALLAALSLAVAPGVAYAQHRGGGGGGGGCWHGGGGGGGGWHGGGCHGHGGHGRGGGWAWPGAAGVVSGAG